MARWVDLMAIAAVFVLVLVLGLRFLSLYSNKASRSALDRDEVVDHVRFAEDEAEALRARAEAEVGSMRRSAQAELEALRRAAATEADAARASAEAGRLRAETAAKDLLADARRDADREFSSRRIALEAAEAKLDQRLSDCNAREAELDAALRALT